MTLDVLRVINLSLLFLFIGLNLAIWKHHYERLSGLVIIGRTGLAAAVILSISSRLLNWPQPFTNVTFNVMLFIFITIYTIGLVQFYREQEKEHDSTG